MPDYKTIAKEARLRVLEMVYKAKSSHIGSNFSVIDILAVLFNKKTEHDQIILSAGWKAAAFYYFLAREGDGRNFPMEWLDSYNQEGSPLIGLTEPGVPGVLFAGGSMQMGFPAAVGFALAKKMRGEAGTVYCVMSDGELAGGMIWESALIAACHKLDNLVVLVDQNNLQAMGKTDEILPTGFPQVHGWRRNYVDGHDYTWLADTIGRSQKYPLVITCNTIKGKGVDFMEGNNLYHYKDLSEAEYEEARSQIQHG